MEYVRSLVSQGRGSINALCRLFGISKKSYYRSKSPEQRLQTKYAEVKPKLTEIIRKNPGYGYRRIVTALSEVFGLKMNAKPVRKLLRVWGLSLPRRIVKPRKGAIRRIIDFLQWRANLLFRYTPNAPFQVVLSDVTEFACTWGKAYLSVHIDYVQKVLLGWKLSLTCDSSLVMESFKMAQIAARRFLGKACSWIQHQDRGAVYTGHEYAGTVLETGCQLSYSRRGEPGDNAANESFFGRFKVEWQQEFSESGSFEELEVMVSRCIRYYNEQRYHSTLGNRAPLVSLQNYLATLSQTNKAVS